MVFEAAQRGGYLATEPLGSDGFPRVPEDRAQAFFEELCKTSSNSQASLIIHSIKRYFHPDRVKYFATSSIGFYVDHQKGFNSSDCCNRISDEKRHEPQVRGEINPINVLEPLLWLQAPVSD
jgi:hypothetical protein